jgi:transcription elongation factor Elf1
MDEIVCPKCGHQHTPAGTHEDDSGEMECESCGFLFDVEVEYDPIYTATCKKHTYGEWQQVTKRGAVIEFHSCKYCGAVALKPENPKGYE